MKLLLLATYRDDESLPDDPAWARLVVPGSRPGVTAITLRRLSHDDTARLVRDVSGPDISEADVRRIAARSGGTPLLVEELVAARDALGSGEDRVPDVVQATVRERSRRAGEEARALLDLAAVMGHDADLDLLVDLRPDQAGALDTLVRVGLLRPASEAARGSVEFRHPLLREAAYEDISWERRRLLHAEAAAALAAHGSAQSAERIARHWELAGRPERAVHTLLSTIEAARRQDNIHRAASLGLVALALIERHERLQVERDAVVTWLVDDLFATGRWTPLLPLARRELSALPAGDPRRAHLLAILGQGEVQDLGTALPDLRRDIEEALAREGPPSEDRALLLFSLGMITWASADPGRARELADRSLATARACGAIDVEMRARVLRAWTDMTVRRDRARVVPALLAAAERARSAGRVAREASLLLQVARVTLETPDIIRAEEAGRRSVIWYELGARCVHALVLVLEGRFTEAESLIADTRDVETSQQALWTVLLGRAQALMMRGRAEEAGAIVAEMEAMSKGITNMRGDEMVLSGWASWETGDVHSAVATFDRAIATMSRSRIEPGFGGPYFMALHVDALCRTDQAGRAARLIAEQTPLEDGPGVDRYTRASFAAARLRLEPSEARLAEALRAAREARWPWLEGLCGAWGAELLGDVAAAREARKVWLRLGYNVGVARLDALLRTPAGRTPHRRLTVREETVADLIVEGLTNAQIAERLGISAVTVAHHVSNVLDKLDVGSRTQVAVMRAKGR